MLLGPCRRPGVPCFRAWIAMMKTMKRFIILLERSRWARIAALAIVTGLWVVLIELVGPRIIADAYAGRSLPVLNRVLEGRDLHPLSHYLESWRRIAWVATGALLAVFGAVLAVRRALRRWGGNRFQTWIASAPHGIRPLEDLGKWRTGVAYATMLVVVGGSLSQLVIEEELWPLSRYYMYAGIAEPSARQMRLVGKADGSEVELTTYGCVNPHRGCRHGCMHPMDRIRLHYALDRLTDAGTGHEALAPMARYCAANYRRDRGTGRFAAAPEIHRVRWYEYRWSLRLEGRSLPDRPERELLDEWVVDGGTR